MGTNAGISQKEISTGISLGKFEDYQAYISEEVRWTIIGNAPVVGKDQVREVLKMSQLQSFPVITIGTVISEGDIVVVESTGVAKTTSGKEYNQTYCDVYHFEDGKVISYTTYLDTGLSNDFG